MPDHRDVRQCQPECLAVANHTGKRNAAHIDAVIGALAADKAVPLRLSAGALVSKDDLDRRIDRLRPRVREEHVVELVGKHPADPFGKLERPRVAELEMRCVVIVQHLRVNGFGDFATTMPGRRAEQGRRSVDDLTALVVPHVHAFGLHHHARIGLEIPIGGKGHPVCFKRIYVV